MCDRAGRRSSTHTRGRISRRLPSELRVIGSVPGRGGGPPLRGAVAARSRAPRRGRRAARAGVGVLSSRRRVAAGRGVRVAPRRVGVVGDPRHRRRRDLHRRRAARGRRAADREGADRAAAGGVGARGRGGRGRGRGRAVHARDDRRHERAARAQGRADGVRRDRRIRAPAAPEAAEPRAPLPALRGASGAARAARALPRRPRADRPRRRARAARARARCRSSPRTSRRSPSACSSRSAIPSHERSVAEELRRRLPRARVVASHELSPELREYERASTTAIDAYLGPAVSGYLEALDGAAAAAGLPEPLVMRSSGGLATLAEAAAHPAVALVSGPAAGVVGAARVAGVEDAITFDMGGTSTDVCLIRGGQAGRSSEREVGGLPLRLPMVDLQTVGAGGGSIVWRDAGGALRVGPESAGADPGPACYGRGGTRPTVTDANLLLGRLPARLAGGLELDRARGRARLRRDRPGRGDRGRQRRDAAAPCGSSRSSAATIRASSRSSRSAARGRSTPARWPRSSGSRPWSCRRRPASSRRSGSPIADERRDSVRSYVCPLEEAGELPDEGEAELRYRGQSFELAVPLQDDLAERVPPRPRGALRLRRPRPADRARRRAHRRRPPGTGARAPERRAVQDHGPGRPRARRRHVLGSPGVGGG